MPELPHANTAPEPEMLRPSVVRVTTGSRLHFGIFSWRPASGRNFGGLGMMIDEPRLMLTAQPLEREIGAADTQTSLATASACQIIAPPALEPRIARLLSHYLREATAPPVPLRIQLHEAIPQHSGLGSGTQLALALAAAVQPFWSCGPTTPAAWAVRAGRGERSAIGLHGFSQGGFLIDDGRSSESGDSQSPGRLASRLEFPAAWWFALITPPASNGLAGDEEREAFSRLQPMPAEMTARLRSLAFEEIEPAILQRRFSVCSSGLYEFGRRVGEFFAPVQGGTYADAGMRELVDHLRSEGIEGVGQSSWGPTIFALLPDEATAAQVKDSVLADPRWSDCTIRIAAPRNQPADVSVIQAGE